MRVIIAEASEDGDLILSDMADAVVAAKFRLDAGRVEAELLKLVCLSVEQEHVWHLISVHESAQDYDIILVYGTH